MAIEQLDEKLGTQLTEAAVQENIQSIAREWSAQRTERQRRRSLDRADFDQLRQAGYHLLAVPVEFGGLWRSTRESARAICECLRILARADFSVALVASMHPAVLAFSADSGDPSAHDPGWEEQRRWMFQTVLDGHFWGPIASEPGSGGDMSRTKAEARLAQDGRYLLSGLKHFGSGSGIVSFQATSANVEGEDGRVSLILDMRGLPWDGSAGVKLVAEWDGHGMTATQSHAFEFSDFPAIRSLRRGIPDTGVAGFSWLAIMLGIVEQALAEARSHLTRGGRTLRPYENVAWSQAEVDLFLIESAYEAVLATNERGEDASGKSMLAKQGIAELAESAMTKICRVIGGTAYSKTLPFGYWFEDVRSLGFLRPPWGLAYDSLHHRSWPDTP